MLSAWLWQGCGKALCVYRYLAGVFEMFVDLGMSLRTVLLTVVAAGSPTCLSSAVADCTCMHAACEQQQEVAPIGCPPDAGRYMQALSRPGSISIIVADCNVDGTDAMLLVS